jgi:hypothetical protein
MLWLMQQEAFCCSYDAQLSDQHHCNQRYQPNMAIPDAVCHCAESAREKAKVVVGRDAAAQAAVSLIMLPADQLEMVSLFVC